jgi:hypothetical protein
LVLN